MERHAFVIQTHSIFTLEYDKNKNAKPYIYNGNLEFITRILQWYNNKFFLKVKGYLKIIKND